MKLYIGKKKITEEEQRLLVSDIKLKLENANLKPGDVLACKAKTQYGIIAEWLFCQETGIIPFYVAPDFPVEGCRFMEYSDVEYCLELNEKEEISLHHMQKGTDKHLELGAGSVIHMTSATSGNPKFIVRSKEQLDLEVSRYCERLKLNDRDVILSIAPFYHAYAFLCPMLGSLYADAALVQPDILLPRNVIELCRDMDVTCVYGIPFFLDRMADTDEKYQFSDSIRYIISSGEKLTEKTAAKFKERFGIALNQQFGCTETGTITFSEADDPYECQGKPIPGCEFRIEMIDGKNHISVNTHGTMGSYITDKITPIADGFYLSNDLGYFDEEGRLFIEGRADDVVIRAGEKINLREIGAILEKMPEVHGVKLEVGNDELKEITCYYNADREIGKEEFITYGKQYLSAFQIPNYYIRVEDRVGQKENWKHKK